MPWLVPIIMAIVTFAETTLGSIVLSIGASLVLGQVAKLFVKHPAASSLNSTLATRTVTARQAVAPWHILYGSNRVGGIITFLGTTGATNEFLQIVITLAGHEVNAIPAMYFDGVHVPLDGSGNATGTFAGFVHAEFNLGKRGQAAFAGLIAATASYGATWTSAHRQRGRAGVYVQLKWDATLFANGVPNITFDVQGRKVYDPRGSGANAADTFTRANGAPGANWTAEDGGFTIASNALYCSSNGGGGRAMMRWNAATFANDHFSSVVVTVLNTSSSRFMGPAVRCATGANTYYGFYIDASGLTYTIFKVVAGTFSSLATGAATATVGDVMRLEVSGTTLTGKKNGTTVATVTDASIAAGSAGIQSFGNGAANPNINNWLGADLSVGGGGGIVYSTNAALCIADYLNNASFGLGAQTKYPMTAGMLANLGFSGFTAANVFDGDVSTNGWSNNTTNAGSTLTVDLGAGNDQEFHRCRMYLSTAGQAQTYDIQYSDNNSTWTTAAAAFLPDVIGWNEVELAPSGDHRYWRILADATITEAGFVNELEFYTSDVDTAALITAANTCDELVSLAAGGSEARFAINGSFGNNELPSAVIPRLNSAIAGSVVYVAGLWGIYPGVWRASSLNLSDTDLRAPLTVQTRLTHRDLFNGVKGTFISPTNNWQLADFPPYADPVFLAEDSNERIWQDVEYPFTISAATCQRISKINLRRVRHQISMQAQFKLTAYQVQPMDVIAFSHPRFGWVNKTFEVTACSLVYAPDNSGSSLAVGVDLTLHETDSTVYDWSVADENSINAPPTTILPQTLVVQPPTSLSLASDEIIRADGIRMVRIIATWVQPLDNFVINGGLIHVEYKKHADTNWIWAGDVPGSHVTATIVPVQDATLYDVRIWSINAAGVRSAPIGLATDSFVRANENPLNPSNWTVPTGGSALQVVGNKCEASSAGTFWNQELYTGASFSADQFAEVVMSRMDAVGDQIAVLVRGATGALTFYLATGYTFGASSKVDLWKCVAATFTQLGSTVFMAVNSGDVLRLEASGTTLTVKVNGVAVITQTDATIAGGSPGLAILPATLAGAQAGAWQAGNLLAGAAMITTGGAISRNPSYSFFRPLTNPLTAHDAGSNVTINIASFTMRVAGLDVSISSGSIGSLSYNTLYYVYYDDGGLAGGAVTFNATTVKETALNGAGRFYIGSIQTPVAGATDTIGNSDGGSGAQVGMLNILGMSVGGSTGMSGNGAVTSPQNAVDTDEATYASITVAGNGGDNRAVLTLQGMPGITRKYSSAKIRVLAALVTNNLSNPSVALTLSYSKDGYFSDTQFLLIVATAITVAKQWYEGVLPAGLNLSQVQARAAVGAALSATGSAEARVYTARIEAIE